MQTLVPQIPISAPPQSGKFGRDVLLSEMFNGVMHTTACTACEMNGRSMISMWI